MSKDKKKQTPPIDGPIYSLGQVLPTVFSFFEIRVSISSSSYRIWTGVFLASYKRQSKEVLFTDFSQNRLLFLWILQLIVLINSNRLPNRARITSTASSEGPTVDLVGTQYVYSSSLSLLFLLTTTMMFWMRLARSFSRNLGISDALVRFFSLIA